MTQTSKGAFQTISGDNFLLPWFLRIRHALHALYNSDFTFAYNDSSPKCYDYQKTLRTPNGTAYRAYFLDGATGPKRSLQLHIGGLRSDVDVYHYMFTAYKQRGNPAIFIDLPEPDDPCDNIDKIRDVVDHVLRNPPIAEKHKDKPITLSTHSTSAALLLCTLMENKNGIGEFLHNKYKRLIAYSTFITPPFVKNPLSNFFYWQVHGGKNSIYGTTLCDRFYSAALCLFGQPGAGKKLARLRHDEIQHMSYVEGAKFQDIIASNPVPDYLQGSKKLTFVHGEWDHVASHDSIMDIANRIGCSFISMKQTFHNPFSRERAVKLCEHFHNQTPVFAPIDIQGISEDISIAWQTMVSNWGTITVQSPNERDQGDSSHSDKAGMLQRLKQKFYGGLAP